MQTTAVVALFAGVNYLGGEGRRFEEVKTAFRHEHATIQQTMVRMARAILEVAAEERYTDLRNEASQRYARAALEATKDIGLPLI
jgi:hypothetical protein